MIFQRNGFTGRPVPLYEAAAGAIWRGAHFLKREDLAHTSCTQN